MKKFFSILVALVLVVGLGVGAYFLFRKPSEATSVMTMSVNPEVQFVLDQNNKVMNVTAVNEDGLSMTTQVNFVGMSAEDASKLFVELSSQMGVISLDAVSGRQVTISISCNDEIKNSDLIKQLKTNVQNSVNQYFKDNGILAGAKVVQENISDSIKRFGSQIEEFTGSTFEEAMTYVNEVSKEFENVAYEMRSTLQTAINAIKNSVQSGIELLKSQIANLQKQISGWKEELNNSKILPDSVKKTLNENISKAEKELKELQNKLDKQLSDLQAKIDAKVKEYQEKSKQALEQLKAEIKTKVENGKTAIENHKKAFEQKTAEEKQALQQKIEEYQNSLLA
ncbi:MAG: hypothetical protein ACI4TI_00525 [Christensenellales bacterium]